MDTRKNGFEVLISTVNRRASLSVMVLGLILIVPYFVFLGVLTTFQLLPNPNAHPVPVLVLTLAYVAIFLLLVYESVVGVFPSTRSLRKILMLVCNSAAQRLGAEPDGNFNLITKWVKTHRLSLWEWRIWRRDAWRWIWQPWPDMMSEEELLKDATPRRATNSAK